MSRRLIAAEFIQFFYEGRLNTAEFIQLWGTRDERGWVEIEV
jgi:hypothetical protein